MNKRIEELELKAAYGTIDPNNPFTAEEFRNFTDKFAELIVRECVQTVNNRGGMCGALASNWITEHFGIK